MQGVGVSQHEEGTMQGVGVSQHEEGTMQTWACHSIKIGSGRVTALR